MRVWLHQSVGSYSWKSGTYLGQHIHLAFGYEEPCWQMYIHSASFKILPSRQCRKSSSDKNCIRLPICIAAYGRGFSHCGKLSTFRHQMNELISLLVSFLCFEMKVLEVLGCLHPFQSHGILSALQNKCDVFLGDGAGMLTPGTSLCSDIHQSF